MSLELHYCAPRSPAWSKRAKSFSYSKSFLHNCPKASLNELDKVERHLNKGGKFFRLARRSGLQAWTGRRRRSGLAPSRKLAGQAGKHYQNRYLRRTRICYQGYCKAGENVNVFDAMRDLHKPATLIVFPREYDNQLPRRKRRSPADSFRENFLSKKLCFQRIF